MSKSDTEGVDKEVGSQVQLVVYRIPKKNHDVMVQTCKSILMICLGSTVYCTMRFSNLTIPSPTRKGAWPTFTKTIAAAREEEFWVEFVYYRDRKHMEEVIAKMEKDEDMGRLYKQSLDLITPGTSFILGESNRLNV